MAFSWSAFGKLIATLFDSPEAGADSIQTSATSNVAGGGFNLGNNGGWSNSFINVLTANFARRGITQTIGGAQTKHAIGDCAAIYLYVKTDGGMAAASDEGACAITAQVLENQGYFHGTVSSTTGTGDTSPVLAHTTGNNWTTDGGYLLDITKGTLNGTLTGTSTPLSLTINSGATATFLNYLTVSGATLPISTAIGIATAAIANPSTTRDNPILTTVIVNVAQIAGVYQPFTAGSVVTIAGINYPEQSVIQTASAVSGTHQQTLTLKLCNPNTQAILFQGGIQGQYISADANLALSGMRSAYFAFGSLLGTDMIYGNQVTGGVANNLLPNAGCEAWQPSGANSAWHLYPGAEVVKNSDQGFACTVEQNRVAWAATDVVEGVHFPTAGGNGALFVRIQYTPPNASLGWSGIHVVCDGPGTAGGNSSGAFIQNAFTPTHYLGSGGPLQAPIGLSLAGQWASPIFIQAAPDNTNNSIVFVQNNNAAAANIVSVINLDFASGGEMTFNVSAGRWHVDKMDVGTFSVSGTVTQPDAPVLTAATTTTAATAGAATALPATPVGYLTISINGTLRKIPYYSV